uniref:Guanylate cyclase domain-containing protein n=1 Tax=Plectus sambesii TaxID=2011161 RepID=A0A914WJR5_9BILA
MSGNAVANLASAASSGKASPAPSRKSRVSGVASANNSSRPSAASLAKSWLGAEYSVTRDKLISAVRLVAISTPPILIVLILSAMIIIQVQSELSSSYAIRRSLAAGKEMNRLVGALQRERGMTCVFLEGRRTSSINGTDGVEETMKQFRTETDTILFSISSEIWEGIERFGTEFVTQRSFHISLTGHRRAVYESINDCFTSLEFYTERINAFIQQTEQLLYGSPDGQFWGKVEAYRMLLHAGDLIGIKRATGGSFFAVGYFNWEMYRYYTEVAGAIDRYLIITGGASLDVSQFMAELATYKAREVIDNLKIMEKEIFANKTDPNAVDRKLQWFGNMTEYMSLMIVKMDDYITEKLQNVLDENIAAKNARFIMALLAVGVALIVCPTVTIFFGVESFRMNKKIRQKVSELGHEKQKTDLLLCQMLPRSIVRELKLGQPVVPRTYSSVTVFFSDIVGFTTLSSKSDPIQIVNLLNKLYSSMDTVLDRYSCYKVETIGDAYMVVSGAPKTNNADHSNEVCTMALDTLREIGDLRIPHCQTETLLMRIGIHTGKAITVS